MNTELYVSKVRAMFPGLCDGHDLRVGWKISRPDGTTHAGYFWPLVNRNHWDRTPPVLHEATAWNPANPSSCPTMEGDGLCVTLAVRHATSGGVPLTDCIGHVLVYPADLAVGEDGKLRVPWCVDVDSFSPLALIREGLCANLQYADLRGANLRYADLWGANLRGANLQYADLRGANLRYASYSQETVFPGSFDPKAAGMVRL